MLIMMKEREKEDADNDEREKEDADNDERKRKRRC